MNRPLYNPRTARKVKDGKVQKKNNVKPTVLRGFVVDREAPRQGWRHLVTKREIFDFIELIPDWPELFHRIERIKLVRGEDNTDASYLHHREGTGTIEICAWKSELIQDIDKDYFADHQSIFDRIELKYDMGKETVRCWFDEPKAKAFILVHIFIHELGHHHDKLTRKHSGTRGEDYAENFARRMEDVIWPRYVAKFGKP